MKSIIMTAQNVRDFLKARTITVKKSSHDRPFEGGDVVFIREPWHRLTNPDGGDSDRFNYAANATAEPLGYKWASPVAMPADAIRYYGRVTFIIETGATVGEWEITLEFISKAEAQAAEAGLPFSTAADPENASDYYTYAGDMTPEDHEKMIAAIDADRERLAEIRAKRKEYIELLKTERDPGHLDGLDASLKDIEDEERDLVARLEDAGVHDTAEEELSETNTTEGEKPAGEQDSTEGKPPAPPDTDDEEVGSFTTGKCNYCGREWGVTLEGAKGGGYPTQRTANAAASRLCDCEDAALNREPIIGVALAVTTGTCRYCNQMIEVGPHASQKAADETASEVCSCPEARIERRVTEQIADAHDRVERLFGESAEALGFKPIAEKGPIQLLDNVVEMIARRLISSATVQIRGQCKAKVSLTTKGKIKVARSETRSCDLEAGE